MAISYGKDAPKGFTFFKDIDIVRLLSLFYLNVRDKEAEGTTVIPESFIEYFVEDIFSFPEAKFHEFVEALSEVDCVELVQNDQGEMKNLKVKDIALFKSALTFFNHERHQKGDKKIVLTRNCIHLLDGVLDKHKKVPYTVDNPTVNIQTVIDELKERNISVNKDDFTEAVKNKLMDDPYLDKENNLVSRIYIKKIEKLLPVLRLGQKFAQVNENKRMKSD